MAWARGCVCLWLVVASLTGGSGTKADPVQAAAQPTNSWERAQERYRSTPVTLSRLEAWMKACVDAAWAATNRTEKARCAEAAIAASRGQEDRFRDAAALHYYRGLSLGILASTRGLSALRLVSQMETELIEARRLDAGYNHAGPDRCLGNLYSDAPGWPISVGGRSKARRALEAAVELAPGYPENHLALAEALVKWGENRKAAEALKALDALWNAAQREFPESEYAAEWAEWRARRQALEKRLAPK